MNQRVHEGKERKGKERKGANPAPGRPSAVTWTVVLLAAGLGVSLLPHRVAGKTPPEIASMLCAGCEVLQDEEVSLPFTGVTYQRLKFWNPKDQTPVNQAWLPGGFLADEQALFEKEREARWNAIGAMDPGLVEFISSSSEDVMLPVYLWGKVDLPEPDDEWLSGDTNRFDEPPGSCGVRRGR